MKKKSRPIGLKQLAEKLGLSQGTVSMALSPASESTGVAAKTRERVRRAAAELNYSPNYHARTLSSGRSYTVGIMVPAISEGYYSTLIEGIEMFLMEANYFFLVTSHRWKADMIEKLPEAMMNRGAEGLIVVNTALHQDVNLPTVRIGGALPHPNSTNVRLDEVRGTRMALEHLVSLGHRDIAFFRGEPESVATEERWAGIRKAARELRIKVDPKRVVQLKIERGKSTAGNAWIGYNATEELLARKVPFTALLAYNDSTAIGAMRALQDSRLRVPEDVSVIGYDDIPAAEYERPSLTTIRQPLQKMGAISAEVLVKRIEGRHAAAEILIEPELVARKSTRPLSPQSTDSKSRARH